MIKAYWSIELNTTCPGCGMRVDLMDSPEFIEGNYLFNDGETNTNRTTGVSVTCPQCEDELEVEFRN